MGAIGKHIRGNVVGYVAVFLALTGSAVASHEAILSGDIVDGEVKTPDLATSAVTSGKIRNGGILGPDIASGAVGADAVADGSLTGAEFADRSIHGQKVGTETLSGANVNDGSLFGPDIANNTLTSEDIGTRAVGAGELDPGAFVASDIAQASATNQRLGIAPNAVQGSEVGDGSLTGADVADDGLTEADIQESSLDTPEAAYGFISGDVELPAPCGDFGCIPPYRDLARKVVEPGSYVVIGKVSLSNGGGAYCQIYNAVTGDVLDWAADERFNYATVTLVGVAGTTENSMDLRLRCSRFGGDDITASQRKIVAIKVNRLVS